MHVRIQKPALSGKNRPPIFVMEILVIGVLMRVRHSRSGRRWLALATAWITLAAAVPLPAFARALSSGPACHMACAKATNCCCKSRAGRAGEGVDAASAPDAAITLHTHCSSRDCAKGIAVTKDKTPQAKQSSIHEISADTSSDRAVSATHTSLVHLGDQPDQSRAPPAA